MTKTKQTVAIKEDTINTPVKTKNGKVRKVRVRIKNCEASKTKSNQKRDKTASSETLLCFVKLKRTLPDSERSYNNNKTILQAQYKANKNEEVNQKGENMIGSVDTSQINDNNLVKKHKRKKKDSKESNDLQKKNCVEFLNSNVLKPTKIAKKDMISKIEHQKLCNTKLTAATKTQNRKHFLSSSITQRCLVKLQNIKARQLHQQDSLSPDTSKINGPKLQESPTTNNRKNTVFEAHSTSITPKRCVVKLPKIPSKVKKNGIFVESATGLDKEGISKRNLENSEYTESIPLSLPSSTPIIDNTKRNNFRKLSLTKSFSKSTETKQAENVTNLKFINDYGEKTQIDSNKNNMEISKSIATTNEVNQLPSTKTKINEVKSIKHIAELSLKRQNGKRNKNFTNSEITQFEPEPNSTIFFEPQRNSTVLESDLIGKPHQENPNEKIKKATPKSQNLANKSDEIENLLNSLDDDDCMIVENDQNTNNKNNKFFHRKKEYATERILKEQNKKSKSQEIRMKRRFYVKRSTITKRQNIYEFLSQSQTSDSDSAKLADPNADVIKKLIEQGKVRVATNCRGKGKPIFKRKKATKQNKKIKKTADRNLKQLVTNKKKVTFKEKKNDDRCEEYQLEDHFDNDELSSVHGPEGQDLVSNMLKNQDHKNRSNDQEGTFSRLARRVLLNQTGRSDLQRKNASVLLGMVKQIVSTPKNRKTPSPLTVLNSNLSPIAMPNPTPASKPSPWRVNEDAYLPTTFNFSRSSGNLPSFSSDFIPSTPRKKKRISIPNESPQTALMNEKSPSKIKQNLVSRIPSIQSPLRDDVEYTQPPPPNLTEPSVISSFSSNDSNAENMPPHRRTPEKFNENDSIFNLKQLPNPRRTLNNRSPLKQINILEVVHLPLFKHPNKSINAKGISREQMEVFGFEENLDDVSFARDQGVAAVITVQQNVSLEKTEKKPKEPLLVFEELLPQTGFSSLENIQTNNNEKETNGQNQTKHDKLEELQMLKDVPFQEDYSVATVSAVQQNDSLEKMGNPSKENLYGFEEFLLQSEFSSQENVETNNNKTKTSRQNQTKHHKLQDSLKLNEVYLQRNQRAAAVGTVQQSESSESIDNHNKEDLFGFEEFLLQTGFSSQESIETNNNNTVTKGQNLTIHDKLKDLRKLKPNGNELRTTLLMENSRNPVKTTPLFDDDTSKEDGMRQRGIKEMLCSTMLNPEPSTSKEALRILNNRNLKDPKRHNFGEDVDLSELFKDPDHETTFNENEIHRTYTRPYKRKRRLKENKYVMILDSDESEDEDEDKTHKSNSGSELAPKKKRNRKEDREKKEVIAFVEEFNKMVKEVDSYELIVENST